MWYNKNMSTKHKIAQYVLGGLARRIIKKYQPRIVGITGSVGKTTTKEAIALVLAERFSVRKNERNHNTEIGVPLTVIGPHRIKGFDPDALAAALRETDEPR